MVPVEVYLTSVYRPDCDYVDGEVLERNLGDRGHRGQRLMVKSNRYRVPDLCVVLGGTEEEIFTRPPFLCIEILSPEDRMSRVWERLHDYFEMGVPNVWVIDPENLVAHIASASGDLHRVTDALRTADPILEVPLVEIFE